MLLKLTIHLARVAPWGKYEVTDVRKVENAIRRDTVSDGII